MASVTFDRVTKQYGNVKAVDDLSIEVRDKEFLVLVGPSGCGKSTSLRMVAGLEDVSRGNVYIGDRLVNEVAPKDRDIAMVFQSYALYPHMTVRDNMAFGLQLRRTPRIEIERRVKEAASILGLDDLLRRKPRELSGGQRQRVALGRAIVREPKVFLMDEPLSNLDAKLRVQTRAELIKLYNRLQTTVIYVTHDQVEAMTMGTRIAVMKDGLLQQLDTPQNLYEHPANTFVAEFIGSPAMNFLPAKLMGSADNMYLETSHLRLRLPNGKLSAHLGKEVTAGIRPEHITIRSNGATAKQLGGNKVEGDDCASIVPVQVEVVEPLGSEAIVYLRAGGHNLVARTAYQPHMRAGSNVEAALESSKLYLFDAQTDRALN